MGSRTGSKRDMHNRVPRFTINDVDTIQPSSDDRSPSPSSPARKNKRKPSKKSNRSSQMIGQPFEQVHQIRENPSDILQRHKAEALQNNKSRNKPKPKIFRTEYTDD